MLKFMGLKFSGVLGASMALFKKAVGHAFRAERECFRGC
jgi:hypothetical protein